jgi:hypothetical protein
MGVAEELNGQYVLTPAGEIVRAIIDLPSYLPRLDTVVSIVADAAKEAAALATVEEIQPRPAAEVLAADPIPADVPVLEGMPGQQVGRDGIPARDAVTAEDYVVQLRSKGAWILPNHDDQADMTQAHVTSALARVRTGSPDRMRASVDTDGTVYVSNGYQAARYIPARLIAEYSTDHCPGCGTAYAVNGDGPCSDYRPAPAAVAVEEDAPQVEEPTPAPVAVEAPKPLLDAATEAARAYLDRKVLTGITTRSDADKLLTFSVPFVSRMVADLRRGGSSPEWITAAFESKRAEAEQAYRHAHLGSAAERAARGRMLTAELYLAIWAGMQEDLHRFTESLRKDVQEVVSDLLAEIEEDELAADELDPAPVEPLEIFRVTIDHHHVNGGRIGVGTVVIEARDKAHASELAHAQSVERIREKNTRAREEMARTGVTWPLDSEDPAHHVVVNVRRAPKRRQAVAK